MEDVITIAEVKERLASPPKPEHLTRKQIGQLRRAHWTVVRGHVKACGHKVKFNNTEAPNSNCISCWEAYFMTSVDLEGVHVIITTKGVPELVKQRGKKFVKAFHGFLSARLLPMLAESVKESTKEESVAIEGGTIAESEFNKSEDRSMESPWPS